MLFFWLSYFRMELLSRNPVINCLPWAFICKICGSTEYLLLRSELRAMPGNDGAQLSGSRLTMGVSILLTEYATTVG